MKVKSDAAEVVCPKCKHTTIVYLPREEIPRCPNCGKAQMVIKELLVEGKSY